MKTNGGAPTDRGYLVGVVFFILGLGTLLPWNFFMTASMYFNSRLNSSEWSNGTVVARKEYYFNNWMTLLSQLPLLLCTLLNSFVYQWVSEKVRIAGNLVLILLLFIFTAILVKVPMETDSFFSVTMATIWFINSFGAVLQGSLFGLVGLLPQRYSSVFMSGQGLAGTFAAVAMLMAISSDTDEETAALGYFITPCVGTLITLLSYLLLPHLEFAKYHLGKGRSKSYEMENDTVNQLLAKDSTTDASAEEGGRVNGHANGEMPNGSANSVTENSGAKQAMVSLDPADTGPDKLSVLEVFKKIKVMAFCVTFVFTVTLSVFPAVTVDVQTQIPGKWERYFISVCCFLTFNLMDWLGRTITSVFRVPAKESAWFPALVVARVVFVPLLMLCNVQPRSYLPVFFHHDAMFAVIMMTFSATSGYFVCLSMSYAPQLVEPKDGETAGALMTFFLALGLSIGAALSFPLRALV